MKRNLNLLVLLGFVLLMPFSAIVQAMTEVKNLRTEYLRNPVGIDVATPRFSWEMNSDTRGTEQTAYEITVSSDAAGQTIIWKSGKTESDKSLNISYAGEALKPMTRYYWHVNVWDNANSMIASKETGYFETGLMSSGWGSAKWIKATTKAQGSTSTPEPVVYTLEMDMTLKSGNAGIIFSASDVNNMYMWSINTHDNAEPLIRRHFWVSGSPATSQVLIGQFFTKADLIDHERHVKIEVANNVIKTYIDNILVDTYTDTSGKLKNGFVGFRAYYGVNEVDERAYYDNIVLKNGAGDTLFSENFEKGSNNFEGTETIGVNGNTKLNMFSKSGETRVLQAKANSIPMFRTKFDLDKEVASARVYASSLGIYDLFINGKRVGTPQADDTYIYDELKPGTTDYHKRAYYLTYDVTKLLQTGNNAIGAQVSSGWWIGNVVHGMYGGTALGFIAKLEIKYTDGTTKTIVTDPATWLSSTSGPILMGDIYNGETYDARLESNWTKTGFDDTDWYMTDPTTEFKGVLTGFVGPTVQIRKDMDLKPVKITIYNGSTPKGTDFGTINVSREIAGQESIVLKKGETAVFDLGQNMVGWVKFTAKGTAGSKMRLRFTEMLNTTGTKSRGDDGPAGSLYTANLRTAKATLNYTLKGGDDETYNPSMTYFGFRYCEVIATEDVEIKSLIGQVVGTAAEEGSTMETSSDLINKLYKNIVWGQRGNFLSIPTDCPQRDERQGWTGDAQVFCRTAAYNADVATFFHKWMNDMRDSQRSDGAYPVIAPYSWDCGYGAGAWSEAGIIVPWTIYQMYADKGILEENFASMEKYMGYLSRQTGSGYKYNGAGTPYGDWLCIESTDVRYVSVCYYAYAAQLMSKISKALSIVENDTYATKATTYETLYNNIKTEFQTRYVNANGTLKQNSQTTILLALKLDLYPNETARTNAINLLRTKITSNGNKLTTGFIGTGTLNQTLSLVGETKTAYNLLLQRGYPSWLYSVDQGATTIWERWNSYTVTSGFNDINMNSFNHYSYGAVAEWMYRYMAGIDVDESNPGFKHIILQPNPDTRTTFPTGQTAITNVKAKHRSYYGDIQSDWTKNGDGSITYTVSIPANTTATLNLPVTSRWINIYEGAVPAEEAEGVTLVGKTDEKATYSLKSGNYTFSVKTTTGIKTNNASSNFSIYPNPVKQILNIAKESIDYSIADISGNSLIAGKGVTADVSKLITGVYFLHTGNQVYKFIKE